MTEILGVNAQALLPDNKKTDRPLFMVFAILAFLATLTLLASAAGYRASADWRSDLAESITVQVKPRAELNRGPNGEPSDPAIARNILLQLSAVKSVTILPPERSQELLEPWLGDTPLPDDLPLPTLLDVRLHAGQILDSQQADAALLAANIRADIDDHRQWDREIKRTTRAAQTISLTALVLIITASITAAIFATRAAITGQRRLIDVLHQVGAPPSYTARLFSTSFAMVGLKAGGVGAVAALLLSTLIGLLFSSSGGFSYFQPGLHMAFFDLYLVVAVPVILAIIIAIASWRTILKTLFEEIYP
ncbi:MAG: hypothetical protein JKY25_10360 [Robiginitomaculum sp.]|nr:hypothetical protein [Robiginitomaculum sp.]